MIQNTHIRQYIVHLIGGLADVTVSKSAAVSSTTNDGAISTIYDITKHFSYSAYTAKYSISIFASTGNRKLFYTNSGIAYTKNYIGSKTSKTFRETVSWQNQYKTMQIEGASSQLSNVYTSSTFSIINKGYKLINTAYSFTRDQNFRNSYYTVLKKTTDDTLGFSVIIYSTRYNKTSLYTYGTAIYYPVYFASIFNTFSTKDITSHPTLRSHTSASVITQYSWQS